MKQAASTANPPDGVLAWNMPLRERHNNPHRNSAIHIFSPRNILTRKVFLHVVSRHFGGVGPSSPGLLGRAHRHRGRSPAVAHSGVVLWYSYSPGPWGTSLVAVITNFSGKFLGSPATAYYGYSSGHDARTSYVLWARRSPPIWSATSIAWPWRDYSQRFFCCTAWSPSCAGGEKIKEEKRIGRTDEWRDGHSGV